MKYLNSLFSCLKKGVLHTYSQKVHQLFRGAGKGGFEKNQRKPDSRIINLNKYSVTLSHASDLAQQSKQTCLFLPFLWDKKLLSKHPVNATTETTWLRKQQMHREDRQSSLIRTWCPLMQPNSSWQLCTANVGRNKWNNLWNTQEES